MPLSKAIQTQVVEGTPSVGFDQLTSEIYNPTPQTENPCNQFLRTNGDKFILVMVGLPARGKTLIARRIKQYLSFFQRTLCEVFNVGVYRRKLYGAECKSDFFDGSVPENESKRRKCVDSALEDLKKWFTDGSTELDRAKVAIYDGTNETKTKRQDLFDHLSPLVETPSHIIFIEVICDDLKDEKNKKIIQSNINDSVTSMPDYKGWDEALARKDLTERIELHRSVYEPISDQESGFTWVKLIENGAQMMMNQIRGFLPGKIVQLLTNLRLSNRPILMSRHGESAYNVMKKIGGDSSLSAEGQAYAKSLAKYVHVEVLGLNEDGSFKDPEDKRVPHARLFTSSLLRTHETVKHIVHHKCSDGWVVMRNKSWRALDEIYAGAFDGMTYKEVETKAPGEFERRKEDKLGYRYPRGESYLDVVQRLDPVVHEIERIQDPILIVAHQGILRIIYAYFMGYSLQEAPMVLIPLNNVIKLSPSAYFCKEERIVLHEHGKVNNPPSH